MAKNKLLEGPIYIADWVAIPWHEHNIHSHMSYSVRLRETTLTMFTKDHQKVLKISDEEHYKLGNNVERNNWCLYRVKEWQREIRTLYENMGD